MKDNAWRGHLGPITGIVIWNATTVYFQLSMRRVDEWCVKSMSTLREARRAMRISHSQQVSLPETVSSEGALNFRATSYLFVFHGSTRTDMCNTEDREKQLQNHDKDQACEQLR